jgi:carbon-monoxide dehydrogenase small subunit
MINSEVYPVVVRESSTLLFVLREQLGLSGAKHGCGEGTCGACTVLLDGKAVNACLVLAVECEGRTISTIEGLASNGDLSVIQRAFIEHHAMQCGFCTPGMIMSTVSLLGHNLNPSEEDIVHALAGNLCRCGTYTKILDAVKAAALHLSGDSQLAAGVSTERGAK